MTRCSRRGACGSELDLTLMFINTYPSLETCGVTVSMIPIGTFSVATAAPAAEAPVPLAMLVDWGKVMRKILSLRMVEGTLFNVTTDGRDIIRMFPSVSAASKAAARLRRPPSLFWMTDTVPPSPVGSPGNDVVLGKNGKPAPAALLKVVPPLVN